VRVSPSEHYLLNKALGFHRNKLSSMFFPGVKHTLVVLDNIQDIVDVEMERLYNSEAALSKLSKNAYFSVSFLTHILIHFFANLNNCST
jgi:hypothetical protein